MERTTRKQLEFLCARINSAKKTPQAPYERIGGGVRDVFSCGHVTKRDLYNRMSAYLVACE